MCTFLKLERTIKYWSAAPLLCRGGGEVFYFGQKAFGFCPYMFSYGHHRCVTHFKVIPFLNIIGHGRLKRIQKIRFKRMVRGTRTMTMVNSFGKEIKKLYFQNILKQQQYESPIRY